MDSNSASSVFPYLRSCKAESDISIEGELKGEIPIWLKGSLIRIGSGLLEVGPDRCKHVFDGLALMHRFCFKNGQVTYQNKFLRSDTYRRNMKANRIVVSEFGTRGIPDPCKTIFQRFSSLFSLDEMTDNDLVNIVLYGGEPYACSETNYIWKIHPETLESIEKVKFSEFLPVNAAIAHAHEDTDGTVYNVGTTYGLKCSYNILKFPPKDNKCDNTFQNGSVVCTIPASSFFKTNYHHSFGMSENYFIFVEQPLFMSTFWMAWVHFFGKGSYSDALQWDESRPARFHVVRRSDGRLLDTVYVAKSFCVFHHINAYEEDNHLVVDMCTYESGEIVKALYVKALEDLFTTKSNPQQGFDEFASRAKRFVLPLELNEGKKVEKTNLVKLKNSDAHAHRLEDGSIFCTPEVLTGTENWAAELPRLNYENFNGKKYKFFYAMANRKENMQQTYLVKCDVESKKTIAWSEEGAIPSEPVFICDSDPMNQDEDSGVLLSSLLYKEDESKVSLLVLNAKTMDEIGRVTFHTKSSVPGDYHGTFIKCT